MRKVILVFCLYLSIINTGNGQQKGKMILESISAPSIEKNLIGEPSSQPIAVYLPPSYEKETQKRYPVVYFLPGYEDTIAAYTKGYINSYFFESSMNSVVTQGRAKEMIVVIVNGFNLLEGCFFYNSPVTGNWEDFVVKDVVNYIDKTYRTIQNSNSRAITGLSMGGFGALHLSMRHPSVFSVAEGEVSGLAAPDGMMKTSLFNDNSIIKKVISIIAELNSLSKEDAHKKYIDTIYYYRKTHAWLTLFSFAYGSAFAPDTNIKAPYFNYPYTLDKNNNLVVDSVIFKTWEKGFGNLKDKVVMYKDSLLILKGYGFDYGTSDYFQWIPQGNIYFDKILTEANIPHRVWKNAGGHGDLHKSRYELVALPYCDSILSYDTINLSNLADLEAIAFSEQSAPPIIDKENKTITVIFKSSAKLNSLKPSIYLSPGAKVLPSVGTAIDFTSGKVQIQVISENGLETTVWTINSSVETSIKSGQSGQTKLQLSPNPSTDHFSVSVEGSTISKIEIIDMVGITVYSQNIQNKKIVIKNNNVGEGLFFVKAYTGTEFFIGKVFLR
jgi:S-formylglutathione hydrolase